MAITETHVVSGSVSVNNSVLVQTSGQSIGLTPGTIVNIGSGMVQTSVSGNVVGISGQSINVGNFPTTSISGQSVKTSISGQSVVVDFTSLSGLSVTIDPATLSGLNVIVTPPAPLTTQAVLLSIPLSGQNINILPNQPTVSGMMFVNADYFAPQQNDDFFVGGSQSGSQPYAAICGTNGVRTFVGLQDPLNVVIPVTNMNQLAITTWSGTNATLSVWAVTVSG